MAPGSFLHNGSVPTLRDLLEPSPKRPPTFYRGNNIYDPKNVGFLSTDQKTPAAKNLFFYDTKVPGNGNKGHEGRRTARTCRGSRKRRCSST